MVLSGYVMAFKKEFKEPLASSTKGSFDGYFLEPHNTVCSMICGTPVEFLGGVRKPIPKTLLLSSQDITTTFA